MTASCVRRSCGSRRWSSTPRTTPARRTIWTSPGQPHGQTLRRCVHRADRNREASDLREDGDAGPTRSLFNYNNLLYIRNGDEIIDRIASSGAGSATKPTDITPAARRPSGTFRRFSWLAAARTPHRKAARLACRTSGRSSYVWVGITSDSQDISEPCAGRTLHWDEDESEPLGHLETYFEETIRRRRRSRSSRSRRAAHQEGMRLPHQDRRLESTDPTDRRSMIAGLYRASQTKLGG
jgi:hypothetical protein